MGIISPYFPKEICLKLASIADANIFIETGTHYGGTTKWAADHFHKVHTIELSEYLYNHTKDELISKGNILPYLGDSRFILPQILKAENTNIVFWLDGHYSGGITDGAEDPCPLLDELNAISPRDNDDVVIIDDARLCGKAGGFPPIAEIHKLVIKSKNKKHILVCDDQIYILPRKEEYHKVISDYVKNGESLIFNLYNIYKRYLPKPKSQSKIIRKIRSKIRLRIKNLLQKTGTFNTVKKFCKLLNQKSV